MSEPINNILFVIIRMYYLGSDIIGLAVIHVAFDALKLFLHIRTVNLEAYGELTANIVERVGRNHKNSTELRSVSFPKSREVGSLQGFR